MRWVTKEADISVLIQYGKDNLSSENYLFVTTKDMLDQTKENFGLISRVFISLKVQSFFVFEINKVIFCF